MKDFELSIEIEGYSGPFDLLCSLVEEKKFQLSDIKISELIRIYGIYLLKTRQVPADTLAEFFYMTSELLLEKTRSLLPGAKGISESQEIIKGGEEFIQTLERYRPYRKAYLWLAEKFEAQSKLFSREFQERETEIVFDTGGGVYMLAKTWNGLHAKHIQAMKEKQKFLEAHAGADWSGFAEDDQEQIDARVLELEKLLSFSHSLSLNEICSMNTSRRNLVITLLALLELCRMGRAVISQEELFSDVRINAKA